MSRKLLPLNYRGLEQRRLCDSHEPAGEAIRQDG